MTTSDTNVSTPTPRVLASAIAHLLDVEERAATRGHAWLRRLAASKAAEASDTLRDMTRDVLAATVSARRLRNSERIS